MGITSWRFPEIQNKHEGRPTRLHFVRKHDFCVSIERNAARAQTGRSDRSQQSRLGRFVLAPPSDAISAAVAAYITLQTRIGGDVNVGRKLGGAPQVRRICELPDVGPIQGVNA